MLYPYFAIGLSEAKCLIVDLTKAQEQLRGDIKYRDSPLGEKTQIASIKMYSGEDNKIGFGIGGNDGRCHVTHFAQNQQVMERLDSVITSRLHSIYENHRSKYYPVNCLGFHPHRGNQFLCTGGGEGKMYFWDLKQKNRIAEFDFKGNSVTQTEIDPTGKYLAYSLGYDWARGIQGYMTQPSKVCVHVLEERELEYQSSNSGDYPIKYP